MSPAREGLAVKGGGAAQWRQKVDRESCARLRAEASVRGFREMERVSIRESNMLNCTKVAR